MNALYLKLGILLALVLAVLGWAYWPTLVGLVQAWEREADYSHGYLVVPLAIVLGYLRRDKMPVINLGFYWGGAVLIAISFVLRLMAANFYVDSLDGWSLVVWLGGLCWMLLGRSFFIWALPSIAFLLFMIPLPYRLETAASSGLQSAASVLSCWLLQSLGQPALVEGNIITLGEYRLEVEQACSGLRMFFSFVAVGFFYVLVVERPLWQKITVLLAILPIAMVSNALRIAATGILFQYAGDEWAQTFSHDAAGWVMIPVGAMFFALLLWYLGRLVIEVETVSPQELVGGKTAATP